MENNPQPNPNSSTPSQDPLDTAKAKVLDIDAQAAEQENMIVASTVDHSIAQSHINQKKGNKLVLIVIGVVLLLALLGGLVFTYYYFVARTQDSDYQLASSYSDAMVTNIQAVKDAPTLLHSINIKDFTNDAAGLANIIKDSDLKRTSDIENQSKDYAANLEKLKSSNVVIKDSNVKAEYTDAHSKIEDFTKMSDVATSVKEFMTANAKFQNFLIKLLDGKSVKSLDDYDAVSKDVTKYVRDYPTVPVKDFNDSIYTNQLNIILTTVNDMRKSILSYVYDTQGSSAMSKKEKEDGVNWAAGLTAARNYDFKVPADPTVDLLGLKATIMDRQSVFWR